MVVCFSSFFLTDGQFVVSVLDASPIKERLRRCGEGCDGTQTSWDVFNSLREFMRGGGLLPGRLRGRCCTQSTDVPALVMRFCMQLLLGRGFTSPSSLNTTKTKRGGGSRQISHVEIQPNHSAFTGPRERERRFD